MNRLTPNYTEIQALDGLGVDCADEATNQYAPYLLHDAALVGACDKRLEVDDALDVGLHVADHLELDIGL